MPRPTLSDVRIIAFVTDTASVERILNHIGEPPPPPPIAPARGPPVWQDAREPVPDSDLLRQPEANFELAQRRAR
jgi:hypothetical protein